MGFFPVKQFQMQVATRFVGETLKKLLRRAEAKRRRHILLFFFRRNSLETKCVHSAPDKKRASAEIDNAPGQAFIHRHVSLAAERIPRVKAGPVSANPFLITQRLQERLSQSN